MDIAIDSPKDLKATLSAPIEIYERTHDAHVNADPTAESAWNFETGWDCFPGLLPA